MAYKVTVGEVVVHVPDGSRVTLTCRNCSGILENSGAVSPGYDARDRVVLAARSVVRAIRGGSPRYGIELDELAAAVDALTSENTRPQHPTAQAVDDALDKCDWCHRSRGEHERQCPAVDPTGRKTYR